MNINDLLTSDGSDEDLMTVSEPVKSPVDHICDSIDLLFSNVKNRKTISEDDFDTWTELLSTLKVLTFGEIPDRVAELIPLINEKEVRDASSS